MSSDQGSLQRPPRLLAGRFRVGEEIGSGATAITYRGWDERLERPVAIKILRSHVALDPTYVRRFQQEARAAAAVSHGNVVDVYDFGQQGDALYIVMQYVDGEDLKRLITREGALPLERAQRIAGQVLDGLAAIHAAGIIHRDIKPQNVLIGRDGAARLTDFGVAQIAEDSGLTTAGTTVGTAAYMAPEQAQAGRITEATDLYAVGVMLYEMLTGFLPFNAPTSVAMMLQHIQEHPVRPSQRLPGRGIPRWMDGVVLQALAKDPRQRFASATAMKQALFAGVADPDAQTTVAIPAAHPQGTSVLPRQQARPWSGAAAAAAPQAASRPIVPPRTERQEGSGLRAVLAGFMIVLLLAVAAGAGWYFLGDWKANEGSEEPPTATAMVVAPTDVPTREDPTVPPTQAPVPTEVPVIIEPAPTDTPAPEPTATAEPSPTPEPTATLEPTPEPTLEPTATEEIPIIEPLDPTEEDVVGEDGGALALATGGESDQAAETYLFPTTAIEEGFAPTVDSTPIDRLSVGVAGDALVFTIEESGVLVEYTGVPSAQNGELRMEEMRQVGDGPGASVTPQDLGTALEDGINDYFAAQGLRVDGVQVTDDGLALEISPES